LTWPSSINPRIACTGKMPEADAGAFLGATLCWALAIQTSLPEQDRFGSKHLASIMERESCSQVHD
jgi:hypothetical protein